MEENSRMIDLGETQKPHINVLLKRLFRFAIDKNYSIVVWRLPSDGKVTMIIDVSGKVENVKADIEELGQGFVFSPFSNLDNSSSCFIQGDLVITEENISFSNRLDYSEKACIQDELTHWLNKKDETFNSYSSAHKPLETTKDEFCKMVDKAVASLDNGKLQKVVLSRCQKIELKPDFDIINSFNGLCEAYPNAFVSIVSLPEEGTWIGASPELLISIDKQKKFKTAAVAGTQLFPSTIPIADVGWKQKDIEEQAMVSRYIINCFKKIRLREFDEVGPRTARAGNLVHLKTDFVVDMQAVNFPQLGTVMIELLHPTSAVCGMPREVALDFIEKNENYHRSFYSGFLGPINMYGESHIYVNIRCMQVYQNQAILYAGAGVTRESVPEKEWEETSIKMNTMMDLLVKMRYAGDELTG